MKSRIYLLYLLVFSYSCHNQFDGFTIRGKVEGFGNGKAVLQRRLDNRFIPIDSSQVKNGRFSFRGKISEPQVCYIRFEDTLPPIRLMLENVSYDIKAGIRDLENPVIRGSLLQDKVTEYHALVRPYEDTLDSVYFRIRRAGSFGNPVILDSLNRLFDSVEVSEKNASLDFISRNKNNVVGPYILWGTLAYDMDLKELMEVSSQFSRNLDTTLYVKQIQRRITTMRRVSVGEIFTDISLPDTAGNPVSLSSLKGKYLLIDFWASWCRPCRRENPQVVAAYKEYKKKGFEIFGISLDRDASAWKKAIRDDGLNWVQVSDLKGWQSEGVRLYGVRAIPHSVLINTNGYIVGQDIQGQDLKKTLAKLIDKKGK